MDWSGAVLHMEVSEVDSASLGWDNYTAETAEGLCQGKTRAHHEGSRTVGRIHMWDHPKGNHYTRAPSPAQGLTLGKNTSAWTLASGAPPRLTAEGAGGTSTGFAVGNWTEKQQKRTYPVVEGEWRRQAWLTPSSVPVLLAIWDKYTGGHGLYTEIINLANVLGAAQPAALQMSAIEAPRANAQEEATPLVECALTPRGER